MNSAMNNRYRRNEGSLPGITLLDPETRATMDQSQLERDLQSIAKYANEIGVAYPSSFSASFSAGSRSLYGRSTQRSFRPSDINTNTRYPQPLYARFTSTSLHTPPGSPHIPGTPPGDPPKDFTEESVQSVQSVHPVVVNTESRDLSMYIVISVLAFSLGIGTAISGHTSPLVTYWITMIGNWFVRVNACLVFPMAISQVIISTAELVNMKTLRLAWKSLIRYFLVTIIASVWCSIVLCICFRSFYQRMDPPEYKIKHSPFAFRCNNTKYIQQQLNGSLACTGNDISSNTTFLQVIDINQRIGIEPAVGNVGLGRYTMELLQVYFPKNIMEALVKSKILGSLIVALVVGIAVGLSYTTRRGTIKSSKNPLFHLVTHIYLTLYTILDWIQVFALGFTIPIMIGAVLAIPDLLNTIHTARIYLYVLLLGAVIQMFVIIPLGFYLLTRENPYKWMRAMAVPTLYAFILKSSFLPMASSTKSLIGSGINPAIFGAFYPILSILNTTGQAMDLPNALMYVTQFSGCSSTMTTARSLLFFGTTIMASLGETALPKTGLTLLITMKHSFCNDQDEPGAVVLWTLLGVLTYRLAAAVNTMTNLMLIRMVAIKIQVFVPTEQEIRSLTEASMDEEMDL